MSDIIEWDDMIIPNDFRNMSIRMVEAYSAIDGSREKQLEDRIPEIKEKMNKSIKCHTMEVLSNFRKTARILKHTIRYWLCGILFITLIIIGTVILNNALDEITAEKLKPLLAIIIIVISIFVPILLIREDWICSLIQKRKKQEFISAQELDIKETEKCK